MVKTQDISGQKVFFNICSSEHVLPPASWLKVRVRPFVLRTSVYMTSFMLRFLTSLWMAFACHIDTGWSVMLHRTNDQLHRTVMAASVHLTDNVYKNRAVCVSNV